jgi:uncharacterized membrane protein YqjE
VSVPPTPPSGEQRSDGPQNIATAIAEVSERATLLVREEIELAKVEVTEKATKLIKGAVVGIAAGVFVLMAVIFALFGFAWLLYYYLPGNDYTYFWGFFAMAVILLLLGALAGLLEPTMAIDEAKKIRETVGSSSAPTTAPDASATPGVSA